MTRRTKRLSRPSLLQWLGVPAVIGALGTLSCSSGDGSKNNASAGSNAGGASNGGSSNGGQSSSAGGSSAAGASNATGGATAGGASATGGSAAGGAAGSGPTIPGLDSCPTPPAGCSDAAVLALNAENTVRLAMGLDCAGLVSELCTSAQNHCDYYATNVNTSCEPASAHDEIDGCPGFTGVSPGDRMLAAGYTGRNWSEVMAFRDDPEAAVQGFINTVYHRTPVLSPWWRDIGYGGATRCDVIDQSRGPTTPNDVTAVYPYANETGVPLQFDGSREGPTPPAPPSGWPSGYPVTLFARTVTIVSHTITVDGTTADIPHVWLQDGNDAWVLYTYTPLTANTTYHVVIQTTRNSAALDFDWKFTTGTR